MAATPRFPSPEIKVGNNYHHHAVAWTNLGQPDREIASLTPLFNKTGEIFPSKD